MICPLRRLHRLNHAIEQYHQNHFSQVSSTTIRKTGDKTQDNTHKVFSTVAAQCAHDIPTTGRSIFLFAMMRLCEHQQAIGTRVGEVNPEAQRINVENDSTLNYTYRNFMLT